MLYYTRDKATLHDTISNGIDNSIPIIAPILVVLSLVGNTTSEW